MTPTAQLEAWLDIAIATARAAGDHALQNRGRTSEVHQQYAHDVKLQLDLECQGKAVAILRARCPDHMILGEEDDDAVSRADGGPERAAHKGVPADPAATHAARWVIDPIDGTVNFFHGLPMWCSSVALQIDGQSVVGVVYAPELGELYTATTTAPACLNGKPIRVSPIARLADAMLLTGLSQKDAADSTRATVIEQLAHHVQKVRVLGSAALDMCRVARGHAEAYWEPAIHVWDMAASSLIVTQAGGRGEALATSGTRVNFVATNGRVHHDLVTLLRAESADRT